MTPSLVAAAEVSGGVTGYCHGASIHRINSYKNTEVWQFHVSMRETETERDHMEVRG